MERRDAAARRQAITTAIVEDGQHDLGPVTTDRDGYVGCLGVLEVVIERFLGNAVKGNFKA